MQNHNPNRRLWKPPIPHLLADWTGCAIDLCDASEFFRRYSNSIAESKLDVMLAEALAASAVIRYARCFATGNRKKLNTDALADFEPEEAALHQRLIDIRNRHIAHPVNEQEIHSLYLNINDSPDASQLIEGITSQQTAAAVLDDVQARLAISLIDRWLKVVERLIQEEGLRLRPYTEQLTRDEVLALPISQPFPNDNVRSSRAQPQIK